MRATRKLTKQIVDGLQPVAKDYFTWDALVPGFGVRVHVSGRRVFLFKYQMGGRTANGGRARRITLGDFPTLTVDEARTLAIQARAQVLRGVDPLEERASRQNATRQQALAPTVAKLVDAFIADRREAVIAKELKATTVSEYDRLLRVSVIPHLGKIKASELTRADVQRLWRILKETPAVAKRAVQVMTAAYNFALDEQWGGVTANPCSHAIRRLASRRKTAAGTSLTITEYGRLGQALTTAQETGLHPDPVLARKRRGMSLKRQAKLGTRPRRPKSYQRTKETELTPADPLQIAAIRFAALTGWRRGEVWNLTWPEVRMSDAAAVLENSKTGRSVRPLGAAAIEILESMRPLTDQGAGAYVFSLQKTIAKRPESRHTWHAVRHAAGIVARLHDLRHSWVSMARKLGHRDEVIAAAIGHVGTSQTSRYGETPLDQVLEAANTVSNAIARAMRGEVAEVLELTKPKSRLKVLP